jgi:predicted dehydrogenase
MMLPRGIVGEEGDIRLDYGLGGGAMMDLGCVLCFITLNEHGRPLTHTLAAYLLSIIRFLSGSSPESVLTATSTVYPSPSATEQLIDLGTKAALAFPNDVTATLSCDFRQPGWGPFGIIPTMPNLSVKVKCGNGEVELYNYAAPWVYHWIRVRVSDADGKGNVRKRVEKAYTFGDGSKGEDWWTTWRYQMEAFVDQVKGRTPTTWISKQDSVDNLKWVEKVYEKVCNIFRIV